MSRRADHRSGVEDNSDITLLTLQFFAICTLQGLELVGPEMDILRDICKGTKAPLEEESVAKAILELKKTSAKTVCTGEWLESDRVIYFCGKIYVPPTSDLRRLNRFLMPQH